MKKIAIVALGLTGLALSACASRYSDGYYDRYGYDRGYRGSYYSYSDRDRDGIPYAYDRDRDNDGVPNYADRRPSNPYRD